MERFTISKFSVIGSILSDDGICVKDSVSAKLREIKNLCKENFVDIHFLSGEKVQIIGKYCRTTKVPKKCQNSSDVLCDWLKERIALAW